MEKSLELLNSFTNDEITAYMTQSRNEDHIVVDSDRVIIIPESRKKIADGAVSEAKLSEDVKSKIKKKQKTYFGSIFGNIASQVKTVNKNGWIVDTSNTKMTAVGWCTESELHIDYFCGLADGFLSATSVITVQNSENALKLSVNQISFEERSALTENTFKTFQSTIAIAVESMSQNIYVSYCDWAVNAVESTDTSILKLRCYHDTAVGNCEGWGIM